MGAGQAAVVEVGSRIVVIEPKTKIFVSITSKVVKIFSVISRPWMARQKYGVARFAGEDECKRRPIGEQCPVDRRS